MTAKKIYKVIVYASLVLIVLFSGGCSSESDFESACPKPGWWDDVSIDGVTINSYDDLMTYWQNKERTNNQFFKAAYQAILDHPDNTNIVVNSINLMPYTDKGYPYTKEMLEYAVNNYFDYKTPLANYGGKTGDTIAGIVEKLAGIYNGEGSYGKTIELINRLFKEREKEINDHMLELISLKLAAAYYESGKKDEAINTLENAIAKYNGSWEERLKEQLNNYLSN